MVRYFGGASSLDVQLGVEAILGPIDAPKWKPDGSLTARLRGTDQAMPPPTISVPAVRDRVNATI
jgi:hypothetical protein